MTARKAASHTDDVKVSMQCYSKRDSGERVELAFRATGDGNDGWSSGTANGALTLTCNKEAGARFEEGKTYVFSAPAAAAAEAEKSE